MTTEKANYDEEAKDSGDWVKLTPGQHRITFLEEIPAPTKTTKVIVITLYQGICHFLS